MTTKKSFLQAGFLDYLEGLNGSSSAIADIALPPPLVHILLATDNNGRLSKAGEHLITLLQARRAVRQAAFDTELAADELRRYQKFVKPGRPSPHIVGLRQKQAAARQATNVAKQSFVKAASAFVREAVIEVPPRLAIEVFIEHWIDANVPKGFVQTA